MVWMAPLIAAIGLMVYAVSSSPRWQRIGEICFFCGLLASLLAFPFSLHLYR